MRRLIDADSLKDNISKGIQGLAREFAKYYCMAIDDEPTAYDADKVLEQLQEYVEEYSQLDENGLHSPKWCAMMEAIDVVKGEGIGE